MKGEDDQVAEEGRSVGEIILARSRGFNKSRKVRPPLRRRYWPSCVGKERGFQREEEGTSAVM